MGQNGQPSTDRGDFRGSCCGLLQFPWLSAFHISLLFTVTDAPVQGFLGEIQLGRLLSRFLPLVPHTNPHSLGGRAFYCHKMNGFGHGQFCISQGNICLYLKPRAQPLSEDRDLCTLSSTVFSNCSHYPLMMGCVHEMMQRPLDCTAVISSPQK